MHDDDDFGNDEILGQVISNYIEPIGDDKAKPYPLRFRTIVRHMLKITGGWPKRTPTGLIGIGRSGQYIHITCHDKLFAYFAEQGYVVEWRSTGKEISKREFYYALCISADLDEIECVWPTLHEPPIKGFLYENSQLIKTTKRTDQECVEMFHKLINYFSYKTALDRDLMQAMFMTPFWGGSPGTRPAFVLSSENDELGGRGVGKTLATELLSILIGDTIDLRKSDNEDIIKRILTGKIGSLLRFDNVTSSATAEKALTSIVTSSVISGHKIYIGEVSVKNYYTVAMTFNGASFSLDMAQRAILITLTRPTLYQPANHFIDYVKANRMDILHGIRVCLRSDPITLDGQIRFAEWSQHVLSRATKDTSIIRHVKQTQSDMCIEDTDSEELDEIIEVELAGMTLGAWETGDYQRNFDLTNRAILFPRARMNAIIKRALPSLSRASPQYLRKYVAEKIGKSRYVRREHAANGERFYLIATDDDYDQAYVASANVKHVHLEVTRRVRIRSVRG